MATNKYIHQLSGNTNPNLTGFTAFDDETSTYKVSLQTLRQNLVDSGSHFFTGSQSINGNLSVSGSVTASFFIGDGSQLTNLSISGVSINTSSFATTGSNTFIGDQIISGSISASYFISTNTNTAENYKVGDNVWLGDVGELNTLVVKGVQDSSSAYIKFGFGAPHQHPYLGHDPNEDANVLSVVADTTKISNAVIIGSGSLIAGDPEMIHVYSSGSFNIAYFVGETDTYSQINVKNLSSAGGASSDIVATADNGTEDLHYVNMGINSSGFDLPFSVGNQNDAYVINRGRNLYIGSLDGPDPNNTHVYLFSSNSWQEPQISLLNNKRVSFNTGSVSSGFTYEFSGSVKLDNELNLVGNQTITGSINFGDGGTIQSISSSSGDGGGYSTLTLTPDSSLGSDQYLILDPTGPNHIHIRPGGTIDNSSSDLYIGGEKNYLRVSDSGASVRMQTEDSAFINGYYFSIGNGYSTAEWYTENGNHYVRFNDPTIDVYNAIWAFNNPSTFSALYDGGTNYISFTVLGSSTPGFPAAPSFYVAEVPPSSPTYLNSVDIEIRQNRQTYVNLSNNDININASDDLRLYARDRFQLRNYSPDEPIEIVLDYDNTDQRFSFNPDGTLGFPDSTIQTTAFTGFPENLVSGSLQISDLGFVTTSSFNQYTSSVQFVPTLYMIEAYANETYTLPGGFTEDPCRYSVVSVNENVPSNWFNTSTYRFTPQKAGYWEINACYDVYRNSEASMAIRKNGSIVASAGSFNAVAQQVIKIVYLNGSTDYIDIVNTGGGALQRYQYQQRSWFQAKWIGE